MGQSESRRAGSFTEVKHGKLSANISIDGARSVLVLLLEYD